MRWTRASLPQAGAVGAPRPEGHRLAPVAAVLRDVHRGRDLEQILTQYTTFVKPAFEEFCLPVAPFTDSGASFFFSLFKRLHGAQF